MNYKFRWNNGFGYEDGTTVPYTYYLENKETQERIDLDAEKVQAWMKENHYTTNDFRNHNERKLTQFLVDNINDFKIHQKFKIEFEATQEELMTIVKNLDNLDNLSSSNYQIYEVDGVKVITKDVKVLIKIKMKDLGISVAKMASYFNISKQYLSQMLNNDRPLQEEIKDQILEILGLA